MRNGKELIIATKPFAKEIRWISWAYTLSTLCILITTYWFSFYFSNIYLKFLFSLFSGLVLVRFFVIYHDHQHHAILNKSVIANIIFHLYGIFMLAPTSIWKRSHDYHHKYNSKLFSASIGSYPIMTKQKFNNSNGKTRISYLASRHPFTILFGYFSMFLFGMCLQSFLSNPRKHWDSLIALVFHFSLLVLVAYTFGIYALLINIMLPFFIAFMLGAYLFYAQHNFPGARFKDNGEWTYDSAALESSSYMKMNFFWRWVTANIGYHHVHHLNARIPFYRLPEAMKSIPELNQVAKTSLNPIDIWRCLKLKVWNPERQSLEPISR